ncbi:MAG: Shedu immune nuclease family protein, partial [Gammaproteobacteria bacterium]
LSRRQARWLVADNQELFTGIVRSELTQEDVVALGYRKAQLRQFETLLNDNDAFDGAMRAQTKRGPEAIWQAFFEANPWIFGYGLSQLYLSGFDAGKLERAVRGHDVLHSGKVVDGLLRTRGLISTLCFAEIKTHRTRLLGDEYRTGCWAPSSELAGAITQVQGTVAAAIESLGARMRPKDKHGTPLDYEVFNIRPKAFIVIGHLRELVTANGVHEDKLRSFEQFRNGIQGVEILTFDELFERSRFIVDSTG